MRKNISYVLLLIATLSFVFGINIFGFAVEPNMISSVSLKLEGTVVDGELPNIVFTRKEDTPHYTIDTSECGVFTDSDCNNKVTSELEGKLYYYLLVLKPENNYVFDAGISSVDYEHTELSFTREDLKVEEEVLKIIYSFSVPDKIEDVEIYMNEMLYVGKVPSVNWGSNDYRINCTSNSKWYLTSDCSGEEVTSKCTSGTTYYNKVIYKTKNDDYFADSVAIIDSNGKAQVDDSYIESKTVSSDHKTLTVIYKTVAKKKDLIINNTTRDNAGMGFMMGFMMNGFSPSLNPIEGHKGYSYGKLISPDPIESYNSIKFDNTEILNNVKTSMPSNDDLILLKGFVINSNPGNSFEVYVIFNFSTTVNVTLSPLTVGTRVENITYTSTKGIKDTSTIPQVIRVIGGGPTPEVLEKDKSYDFSFGFVNAYNSHDFTILKVNGEEITYSATALDTSYYNVDEENNKIRIHYKFTPIEEPSPTGSGSKKYKAVDTKDTTEKISGSGKKGSTRTITPIEGKKVSSVVVTDKDGNKVDVTLNEDGTYSFVQPASNVNVQVNYKNREITLNIGSTEASVDDEKTNLDVAPVIRNDRTMLPIRFVAENLGAKVEWDEKNPNYVVITRGDSKIEITLGSDIMKVNGKDVRLDSVAFAENDRTYLPVRAISEALNAIVEWNENEPSVVKIFER